MKTYVLNSDSPITFTPEMPPATPPFSPVTLTPISLSGQAFAEFSLLEGWTEAKIMLNEVALSGSDCLLVQLYVNGVWVTAGYESSSAIALNGSNSVAEMSEVGFIVFNNNAVNKLNGSMELNVFSSTVIEANHGASIKGSRSAISGAGRALLAATPTKLRVIAHNGNTLASGAVNVTLR